MERNQLWLVLGLALAVGISFEIMKGSSNHVRLAGFGRFEALLDDGRPLYTPGETQAAKRLRAKAVDTESDQQTSSPVKLAGLTRPAPVAKVAAAADPKATAKKDDKTAKKDDKKKKKKKKKKREKSKNETADKENEKSDEAEKADRDADKDAGAGAGDSAGPMAGALNTLPYDGIPRTYEEWERHLMYEPSFQKSTAFIKYFQTGVVSDEIFYAIVETMLVDSRSNVREYGVMALGASPSPRSFSMLVELTRSETGRTRIRDQIRTYLNLYTRLDYLRHLAGAMRLENDPYANYQALVLLRTASEIHLRNPRNQQPDTSETEPGRVPANSAAARYFNPFLNILQMVSTSSRDDGIRQTANQTLSDLKELLESSPT